MSRPFTDAYNDFDDGYVMSQPIEPVRSVARIPHQVDAYIDAKATGLKKIVNGIPKQVYWVFVAVLLIVILSWLWRHMLLQISWGPTVANPNGRKLAGALQLGSQKALLEVPKFTVALGSGEPLNFRLGDTSRVVNPFSAMSAVDKAVRS